MQINKKYINLSGEKLFNILLKINNMFEFAFDNLSSETLSKLLLSLELPL